MTELLYWQDKTIHINEFIMNICAIVIWNVCIHEFAGQCNTHTEFLLQ